MRRLRAVSPLGWAFLAACIAIGVGIGTLSIGLAERTNVTCKAANRSLQAQRDVWTFMEQTVHTGWKKTPPTAEQRKQTDAFFAGVKARLQPAKC